MQRFKGTVFALEPETIVIDYLQPKHVNAEGKVCHGPDAKHLSQLRHQLPPHLSHECRQYCAKLFQENPDISIAAVLTSKNAMPHAYSRLLAPNAYIIVNMQVTRNAL